MMDLTFSDALVANLMHSVADVVDYYLGHMPPEQEALLSPMLLAKKATIIVSVCTDPPEVVGFVQPVDPSVGLDPIPLFKIVAPTGADNDLAG